MSYKKAFIKVDKILISMDDTKSDAQIQMGNMVGKNNKLNDTAAHDTSDNYNSRSEINQKNLTFGKQEQENTNYFKNESPS